MVVRREWAYLSVKTLGAFSKWLADMKVNRCGRNPAFLIAEMGNFRGPPGGHNG